MNTPEKPEVADPRHGWCPVYDSPCPQGDEAAQSCQDRFDENYDPMNNLRDAAITFCAIQRSNEGYGVQNKDQSTDSISRNINQSFDDGAEA